MMSLLSIRLTKPNLTTLHIDENVGKQINSYIADGTVHEYNLYEGNFATYINISNVYTLGLSNSPFRILSYGYSCTYVL